jgi:succinyl-CoA synthetase alpha subunit
MGGDAYVGMNLCKLLALFEKDEETKAVAFYGEIGTTIEEDAAKFIKSGGFTKPMVAYIAGRYTRPEIRFGHAGAIITRGRGRAEDKIRALKDAGVRVVEHLCEIGNVLKKDLFPFC